MKATLRHLSNAVHPAILVGVAAACFVGTWAALEKIGNLYAAVIIAVALVAMGGLILGLTFYKTIASPLVGIIGGNDYSAGIFAGKPPYNLAMGQNYLVTRKFELAHEHALKMIHYYPREADAYVLAYEAIQLGDLGNRALNQLDRLSKRHLGRKIDRSVEIDPRDIEWRGPRVIQAPPTYAAVKVPKPAAEEKDEI